MSLMYVIYVLSDFNWIWQRRGSSPYLREIGLEAAVKRPGLHVFRHQSLCSEHVQTQTFSCWTQVFVNFLAALCRTERRAL